MIWRLTAVEGRTSEADSGTGHLLSRRILVVASGDGGGVGRVESLICSSLGGDGAAATRILWKRRQPQYVRRDDASASREWVATNRVQLAAAFATHVATWRPELVVFTHVNLARLAMTMPSPLRPVYVVVAHGVEVWARRGADIELALRRATGLLAVSSFTAARLTERQGIDDARVRVVNLGVESSASRLPTTPVRRHAEVRLLSVARLETRAQDKGVDFVLTAVAKLLEDGHRVRYVIVGEGDDLPRLMDIAAATGIQDSICFRGRVDEDQLHDEYSQADVFVLPSRREGFGLVFLEAMAAGLPVLAWKAGGTPDVVVDGQTGLLVEDEDELLEGLRRMLGDPELCRRLGEAGYARLRSQFSPEAFRGRLLAALTSVVAAQDSSDPGG